MYDKKCLIEWKISLNSDCKKWTLEKTEWTIKNGQSWDTSNIEYTQDTRSIITKHNKIYILYGK
jgi:hypothetical protein